MEQLETRIAGSIYSAKFDNSGECKLTICIPQSDCVKAAELAIQNDVAFDIIFKPIEAL